MKYLDTPELPSALRNLLTRNLHVQTGKYSVTGLIAPPRIMQLRKRHDFEITLDPYERLWLLFGSLTHTQLESVAGCNDLAEEHMVIDIDGVKVSGSADLLEGDTLYDYKTTSSYSIKEGIKIEWIRQISMYAYLYSHQGFPVKHGKIVAILRDWSKTKAEQDKGYPQKAIQVIDVPLMSSEETLAYMKERVALHEAAEKVTDSELPLCTSEERWERPNKYAIMKKGNKRAVKLYNTKFEAEVALDDCGAGHSIEERKGECVRCEGYCEVNKWCDFYKKMKEENK